MYQEIYLIISTPIAKGTHLIISIPIAKGTHYADMCAVSIVVAKKTITLSDISYIIIGSSVGTKIGT